MNASHIFPQHAGHFPWEWVWLMWKCAEPALDVGQGLLFALWLSQPLDRVLAPAVGVEALRVRFDKAPLPLSVCSVWREVSQMKQVRFHVHNELMCHPHRHLWFCPEATQDLVLFSVVFVSDLVLGCAVKWAGSGDWCIGLQKLRRLCCPLEPELPLWKCSCMLWRDQLSGSEESFSITHLKAAAEK